MNHALKAVPADRAADLAACSDPVRRLAPGLVEIIAAFLRVR